MGLWVVAFIIMLNDAGIHWAAKARYSSGIALSIVILLGRQNRNMKVLSRAMIPLKIKKYYHRSYFSMYRNIHITLDKIGI